MVEVSRLRRIVTNLADNAVKHAGAGAGRENQMIVGFDAAVREHDAPMRAVDPLHRHAEMKIDALLFEEFLAAPLSRLTPGLHAGRSGASDAPFHSATRSESIGT